MCIFFLSYLQIYIYIFIARITMRACVPCSFVTLSIPYCGFSFPEDLVMDPVCRQGGKETYVNVASETSSNQQVVFFWLPCTWWNRKPYIIWAFPVVANRHREGGTNIPVKILTVKLSHHRNRLRRKKKSRHYANPSNGGGPGRWSLFGKWKERLQPSRIASTNGRGKKSCK